MELFKICDIIFQSAAIHENIGYPEWILNDTRLNDEYKGVRKYLTYSVFTELSTQIINITCCYCLKIKNIAQSKISLNSYQYVHP